MLTSIDLSSLVKKAWFAYENASNHSFTVKPSIPILFFGDLSGYLSSSLRVLSVGLNPSHHEFPVDQPFSRFPSFERNTRNANLYIHAISGYFQAKPYRKWFSTFDPLLRGLENSFYSDQSSTALHTDILSPIATNPTWNRLSEREQATLKLDGIPLWHGLLEELRPQVLLCSIRRELLNNVVEFKPLTEWQIFETLETTKNGFPRKTPYKVSACWYEIKGEESLFVHARAAERPFGSIANEQKLHLGKKIKELYQRGI